MYSSAFPFRAILAAAGILLAGLGGLFAKVAKSAPDPLGTQPRAYAEVPEKFYNAAFASWMGPDNLMQRRGLSDPEAIEQWADRLAGIGLKGVEYAGRHFRWNHLQELAAMAEIAARTTAACHQRGMFVIEHHDFAIPTVYGFPEMTRRLDWLQRDVRTGEPLRWFDPLHPEFQQTYLGYLEVLQAQADFDGFMLDEMMPAPTFGSASPAAMETIEAWGGHPPPVWMRHPDPDLSDPGFRSWTRWRNQVESRALGKIYAGLRQRWPGVAALTYGSAYSFPTGYLDLTVSAARFANFVGYECITFDALQGWQGMLRELKERASLGDYYHIPTWVLLREPRTADQLYFAWALAQLTRHSTWLGGLALRTEEQLDHAAKYLKWRGVMPHRHARFLTDTGVLLSMQTRNTTTDPAFYWTDFTGWTSLLTETSRQFDVLLDGDLQSAGRLGKYAILILASQACLTDEQCEHLKQWVADGGTAILTRNTSLYEADGRQRADFALGEAVNIALDGRAEGEHSILAGEELRKLQAEAPIEHRVRLRDPARSRVLAATKDERGDFPAIVETPLGKGRFIYVAPDLGESQSQPEMKGGTYPGMRRPDVRRLMERLVDYARTSPPPIDLILPRRVVGTAFQISDGPGAGDVYVHVINVRGMTLQGGETVRLGQVPLFSTPSVGGKIHLDLHGIRPAGPATVECPLTGRTETVELAALDNGKWGLDVPAGWLGAYLQIRIPADKWAKIVPPPVPLASEAGKPRDPADTGQLARKPPAMVEPEPVPISTEGAKAGSAFEIKNMPDWQLRLEGKVIVQGDAIEYAENHVAPALDPNIVTPLQARNHKPVAANSWSGWLAEGEVPWDLRWVREVAARGDEAEVTMACRLPPRRMPDGFGAVRYLLYFPVQTLAGAEYKAFAGAYKNPDPRRSGKFTGKEPEGEVFLKHLRTIAVKVPGAAFTLDFDWSGPSGLFETETAMGQTGHVRREGDRYVFAVEFIHVRNGGDFFCKAIFRKGFIDPESLHPVRSAIYFIPPPTTARVQFTAGEPAGSFSQWQHFGHGYATEFAPWGTGRWNPNAGMGWVSLPPLAKLHTAASDSPDGPLFGGGVSSSGSGTFRLAHRNAGVIVSVMLAPSGQPVRLRVNNGEWRETNGGRRTELFPVSVSDGAVTLEIDGPAWTLSGLSVQPLVYDTEDYVFSRNYWAFGRPPWQHEGFPNAERWADFFVKNFGPRPLFPSTGGRKCE